VAFAARENSQSPPDRLREREVSHLQGFIQCRETHTHPPQQGDNKPSLPGNFGATPTLALLDVEIVMSAAPSAAAGAKLGNGVLEAMANMKEGFQYMKEAGAADSGDMMWQHQGAFPA